MPPTPAQSQQTPDNSLSPLWITVGLFILGWLLWAFFHTQIVSVFLVIKSFESRLIALVLPSAAYLPVEINHLPADRVTFSVLLNISYQVGTYLRYPIMVSLGVFACIVYFTHVNLRFKKIYSMESLAKAEEENWPQISPVIGLNLVDEDIDQGPWAMALSPMQFAKKYHLLSEEKTVSLAMTMASRFAAQVTAHVRREAAYQVFVLQLGEYWQGIEHLPLAIKILFVAFVARANHDQEGSRKLLLQAAQSAAAGKLHVSGVDDLWEKHKHNKFVNHVIHSHAYVLTVMASMLVLARKDGVLASADFLWLKPIDRSLWFMLNCVGRQCVFSEVAGPFAHWNVERAMRRRLLVPMVDEAVNGLEMAIKDILYMPDSDNEG